jgi:hypothetical protein
MIGTAPRVFISYSHDSDEHRDRVLELATGCAPMASTQLSTNTSSRRRKAGLAGAERKLNKRRLS